MTDIAELDAMKLIDDVLKQIHDQNTLNRILVWANSKFGKNIKLIDGSGKSSARSSGKSKKKSKSSSKSKAKFTPTQVKDLDLSPKDSKSLKEFNDEKMPTNIEERGTAAVYYLRHILEIDQASINHVFTCFKHLKWRIPANLPNALQRAGSKGWLDTSDREDLITTPQGDNLIEYDLPKKTKK